jgi:hypothetical protein
MQADSRLQFERKQTMTSFAHVDYPTEHPGVARAERLVETVQELAHRFDSARAFGSVLLAAIVAALLVVANQVVDTWTDGHLLAAWIVMWTVAFGALALFAQPIRRTSAGLRVWVKRWTAARKQAADDEKMWRVALNDARVMADISRAMSAAAVRDIRRYY